MTHPMRKSNREITGREGLLAVLDAADVCRVGLCSGGAPYIVPMNFGYDWPEGGALSLYFHCAKSGRKTAMMAENPIVGFELDTDHELVADADGVACDYTMKFASIIGSGRIEAVTGDEGRLHAMDAIMKRYATPGQAFRIDPKVLAQTTLLKLTAAEFKGKRLK